MKSRIFEREDEEVCRKTGALAGVFSITNHSKLQCLSANASKAEGRTHNLLVQCTQQEHVSALREYLESHEGSRLEM